MEQSIKETDLFKPVSNYLEELGYMVRSEVRDCDITAIRGDELVVIELKKSFNVSLLIQAVQRQKAADSVYIAIPKPPAASLRSRKWSKILHLLRRLELGLIFVNFAKYSAFMEIHLHPAYFDRKRSALKGEKIRKSIISEVNGRPAGDFNTGGSPGSKRMTSYREASIHIACLLERFGPMQPAKLALLGAAKGSPKAVASILRNNYYGWFERVSRGLYKVNANGIAEIGDYPGVVSHYREIAASGIVDGC